MPRARINSERMTVQVYRRSRTKRSAKHVRSTTVSAALMPQVKKFLNGLVVEDLKLRADSLSAAQRNNDAASLVRDTTSSFANAGASNSGHRVSPRSKSSNSPSVRAVRTSRASLAGDRKQVAEMSPHKS